MNNYEIEAFAKKLDLTNFRGVFCRDTLPQKSQRQECGIFNLNLSSERGSHWVSWFKDDDERCYFVSYGAITPTELINYLKTPNEIENGEKVIYRNSERVQEFGTSICGQLCLLMLYYLCHSPKFSFQDAIDWIKHGSISKLCSPYTEQPGE